MRRARTSQRRGREAALVRLARSARDARGRVRQALRLLQPGPRLLHRQGHSRTSAFFATVPRMTAYPPSSHPSVAGLPLRLSSLRWHPRDIAVFSASRIGRIDLPAFSGSPAPPLFLYRHPGVITVFSASRAKPHRPRAEGFFRGRRLLSP